MRRKCQTVQYSTVQYSTDSTVQYSTVQYSTEQYSTVQYSTVQSSAVQYSAWRRGKRLQGTSREKGRWKTVVRMYLPSFEGSHLHT